MIDPLNKETTVIGDWDALDAAPPASRLARRWERRLPVCGGVAAPMSLAIATIISVLLSLVGCQSRSNPPVVVRIESSILLEPSGRKLSSFFIGLRADPNFAAAKLKQLEQTRVLSAGGCGQKEQSTFFSRALLFLEPETA